ncbi:uncharacterized protein LOC112552939 [Pogonomyrmex barbatus]|uniref:Uncharacterized protein LOC112552939 n=1 Tax=Pogonomyrmex barbatus TaxID=144034 RepID=A0A8N1SB81_9HYME|nr:uncharacterized protein LOC112552939 [Pogonomyrmex barbatus]
MHKCRSNTDKIRLDSFSFLRSEDHPRCFLFVMLMSIAFVRVVPLQRAGDQSGILKDVMDRQSQRDKSSRYLIPCTATFIEEYFEYPEQISFLLPDALQDISDVVELLMNKLRITSAIYTLNVSLNVAKTHDALTNAVILSESGIALDTNDSSFVNNCEYDCNFIIVLTSLFTDKESFLTEAATLVQQLSPRSIFKLAILASVGDTVLFASSLPVRTNESYALAEPAFSGRCEREATAIRWQHFANKAKSSLGTINVAMFNNFPFASFINDTDHPSYGGVEGSMVEEIARSMKIKLNREVMEWVSESATTKTELYLKLHNATNDLVFGGLLWDFSRDVTYTTCYGMVRISWLIPFETNVSLRGLISPFGAYVWYAIICALIAGGFVKLFFIRDITFLDITGLIFGVSVFRQPTKNSGRIQFISWTLFGFFLTQLYLGSLADFLMSTSEIQMDSMEELVNSRLKIGGTQRFMDLLNTPDKADLEERIVPIWRKELLNVEKIIREKFIVFNQRDFINQFQDLVEGRNTSFALLVMLNLTNNRGPVNIGHGHILKETVGTYPLAFATWQDFPYLKEFNFKIQMLVQTGLVEFWSDMVRLNENNYHVEDEEDDSKLDIEDITPAFLLLIMGYLGGCCLLIIEVIFYPSKWFL